MRLALFLRTVPYLDVQYHYIQPEGHECSVLVAVPSHSRYPRCCSHRPTVPGRSICASPPSIERGTSTFDPIIPINPSLCRGDRPGAMPVLVQLSSSQLMQVTFGTRGWEEGRQDPILAGYNTFFYDFMILCCFHTSVLPGVMNAVGSR